MQRLFLGSRFTLILVALFVSTTTKAQHQVIPGATMNASSLFGLPRFDHCALTFNNTLYIFGGRINNDTVALQFSSSSIASQPPIYRPIYTDKSWLWHDIMDGGGCAVTSYGQVIMLPPEKPCAILNLDTLQPVYTRISGSPLALDSFGTNNDTNSSFIESPSRPRRQIASTMWNDILVVFGGLVSDETISSTTTRTATNWTLSQTTFVLDARIQSQWFWHEAPMILGNTPPAGTNAVMVSTQRWILLFSIVPAYNITSQQNTSSATQHNVSVYCFDPYVYMWTGKVVHFISQTDTIKAEFMATANNTDSVLVVPAYSSSDSSNVPLSPSSIALLQSYGLWRLEMSTNEATGTIHWIPPSRVGPFRPLVGGSMTKVSHDLIVLYGGMPFSHDSFRFWNTSMLSFLDARWWNEIQWHPNQISPSTSSANDNQNMSNRKLAIILGTVLGFLFLVMIIFVYYWCCYRRRRHRDQQDAAHNHALRSPMVEDQRSTQLPNRRLTVTPDQVATAWATQLKRALSSVGRPSSFTKSRRQSSLQSTPAHLPSSSSQSPPPASSTVAQGDDEEDHERQRQIREASRFHEHFNLMAPADTNILDRVSEEEQTSTSSEDREASSTSNHTSEQAHTT